MAEPVKPAAPAAPAEKLITLLNNSPRSFHVKIKGQDVQFKTGESVEVPESVAKDLLGYDGVLDASKIVKGAAASDLRAENAKLKTENLRLQKENDDLKKAAVVKK